MGGTGSVVQHDRSSCNRAGERSMLKLYNRNHRDDRPTPLTDDGRSKAVATVGDDEKRPRTVAAGSQRAERVRARDKAMVQMYNGGHANLGPTLTNLRLSLRQGAINGTGWATVIAVSAALEQVGISADSGTVFKLADQGCDTHQHVRSDQEEQFQDSATAAIASPKTQLVYWPNIIDFLEEGLGSHIETCAATIPECKKRRLRSSSPEITNQCRAPRLNGDQAMPVRDDNEESLREGETNDDHTNPETTPECNLGGGDGFANEGSQLNDGITLLNQGLSRIDAGLRQLEFGDDRAGLSPSQIAGTMDSIRGILEVTAGVPCRECIETVDKKGPHDEEISPGNRQGTKNGCGAHHRALESIQRLDSARLVEAACMAGKRGDMTALRVFSGSVDLRTSDAFGRNALYYTSLCGHVKAAHFVAVHAYGGVEGIPEQERWECRKNALSEEMRHYLDTGTLPSATPAQLLKSDERRPVQAVPAVEERSSSTSVESRRGEELAERAGRAKGGPVVNEGGKSGGGAHHAAPPADPTISIASLFGWGHDREKDEDY